MTQQTAESPARPDSPYAWRRLGLSVLSATVLSVGIWATVLVMPQIQADFAISRAEAAFAYTLAMSGFALGNFLLGRGVDRYGIAPIMAFCALLASSCFALSTVMPSYWPVALLQFPIGLASAAAFGPLMADISHFFRRYRGIAVAATACGNYLAGSFWPLVLKAPIAENGWRFGFLIIAVAGLVVILPIARLLRNQPGGHSQKPAFEPPAKVISLSSGQLTALLMIAGFGCCMAMAMPQVHIVAYCVDLGFGSGVGAEMLAIMLGAGIPSRLLSGYLADRFGGVPMLLVNSVLQCLALFLYIPFNGIVSLYVVSLVFGLSQGGLVPSYAIIVREYLPAEEAGRRIGFVLLATVLGMAAGGWASGYIYDLTGSYRMAFIHGIAWNLINMSIAAFVLVQSRPSRPDRTMAAAE
ncbi:MAG: MFS transporter [Nitratireductor sp.]|nr:MFS transporter [Nitratireductor sp.]